MILFSLYQNFVINGNISTINIIFALNISIFAIGAKISIHFSSFIKNLAYYRAVLDMNIYHPRQLSIAKVLHFFNIQAIFDVIYNTPQILACI